MKMMNVPRKEVQEMMNPPNARVMIIIREHLTTDHGDYCLQIITERITRRMVIADEGVSLQQKIVNTDQDIVSDTRIRKSTPHDLVVTQGIMKDTQNLNLIRGSKIRLHATMNPRKNIMMTVIERRLIHLVNQ